MLLDMFFTVFNPAIWAAAAVAWCIYVMVTHHAPDKVREGKAPPLRVAEPGSLYSDGSTATSKLEMSIRNDLERKGFKFYPQGTALFTFPDELGNKHKYTPDMICMTRKVIVEVDPLYTHAGKEADDARRSRLYQQLGYGVVRVRIGKGMYALGKYDVVLGHSDYRPHTDLRLIVTAIRRAKPEKRSSNTWRVA